nr:zinc ribbon domain-containing protein [Frankia tisae]
MDSVRRPLPLLDDESRPFWEKGRDGALSFVCCRACGALLHPPRSPCADTTAPPNLGRRQVPGRGVVAGVTVNHQMWDPRMPPPYAVAIVAPDAEQADH